MSTIACRVCGKPVLGRGARLLCSVACSASERKGRAKGPPRERVPCAHCGETFRKTRPTHQFCKASCEVAARRAAPEPPPVPGARWIALPHNRFALVDEADFETLSSYVWSVSGKVAKGRKLYVHRSDGGSWVKMHTQIMGPSDGALVDHRNGDTFDNRRQNLRWATATQNAQNTVAKGGKSQFKGVCADRGRWAAKIVVGGQTVHLGTFDTQASAGVAYDNAARERHGEFARLNFPRHGEAPASSAASWAAYCAALEVMA